MKIDIITIHNITNVGSVFQAWALNRYLLDQGYDCEVIDYIPHYLYHLGIKSELGKLLNWRAFCTRTRKYNHFVHTNVNLTQRSYRSLQELKQHTPKADLFMAGGDQLWNEFYPCGRDDVYKLAFTDGIKMSYGTSLGKATFTKEGMAHLKALIQNYRYIGIREESGVALLREAGLSQTENVCDPVFLLPKERYEEFIGEPICKEPYLLVYLVNASPLLDHAAELISRKLGLRVILCSGFQTKTKCDLHLKDLGPEESLNYLTYATYVLSGSFHASAFSLMMHKPFLTLLPGADTNARIENLLELVGLEDRMISAEEQLSERIFDEIDWKCVDVVLNAHTEQSKKFLLDAVRKVQEE